MRVAENNTLRLRQIFFKFCFFIICLIDTPPINRYWKSGNLDQSVPLSALFRAIGSTERGLLWMMKNGPTGSWQEGQFSIELNVGYEVFFSYLMVLFQILKRRMCSS